MSTVPMVVVFFEAPSATPFDLGPMLLHLATAAWQQGRLATLMIDADPAARLTRAVHAEAARFRPDVGSVSFDAHLLAAGSLEPPPAFAPWRLTRRALSILGSGGDPIGAHSQALAAVVASGGALDLRDRLDVVLRPVDFGNVLTLVLSPPPGGGLGALLAGCADVVVPVGDLRDMGSLVAAIERVVTAASPMGPIEILPLGRVRTRRRLVATEIEARPPVVLEAHDTPEAVLPLLDALLASAAMPER